MPGLVRAAYQRRLQTGEVARDDAQAVALEALARLESELAAAARRGLFRKAKSVRGVYLWGPVGRGKSMLMDLFFAAAPVRLKRRVHFHAFMAEVHRLTNLWRTSGASARRASFGQSRGDDPIPPVSEVLAKDAMLLCFDELEVNDIAAAMILGRLFEQLFARGVTLVATSNRSPDDLYRDGLNRQLFMPFIDLLEDRLDIVALSGPRDYRLAKLRAAGTWFAPINEDNQRRFDTLWRDILGADVEVGATLDVQGRRQHWPRASGGLLRTDFASLCVQARGPADYLAMASRFHTVFLEGLPKLAPEQRNEARRLAIFVDTLYEARGRLVALADGDPESLYPEGDGSFSFQRTASRLREMRSAKWLEARDVTRVSGAA